MSRFFLGSGLPACRIFACSERFWHVTNRNIHVIKEAKAPAVVTRSPR